MLENLLDKVSALNEDKYSELLFNLYEDENEYTIEAVFDDDELVIGRDTPFVIETKKIDWEEVLKEVGTELKKYFKVNKTHYCNIKSIAYGFVDGDLYYVRKGRKKKEKVKFSKEDFYEFDSFKLGAWLTVYLTDEAEEKYQEERWNTDFNTLSEDKFNYWCEILADNFDYSKYGK